jgi:circadian clock protein KaiC
MNHVTPIQSIPSGVPGLDLLLGGGFPEHSLNIIAGPPGCGKTTLAHQLMFAHAGPHCKTLYLTSLGDPERNMLRYQRQFGFFDAARLDTSVHYVNLAPTAADGDAEQLLAQLDEAVRLHAPALVFIDAFRAFATGAGATRPGRRPFVERLAQTMAGWQATVFVIGEHPPAGCDMAPAFSAADSILMLDQSLHRNAMVRKIQVTKVRGQAQTPGMHSFRIGADGLVVFPRAYYGPEDSAVVDGAAGGGAPRRLSMGNPALDEMLGGGLPVAYSLLVVGPSGSGKSILATDFLAEGARCGENGVIAAFERGAGQRAHDKLQQLVDAGKVGMVDTSSLGLSIDEILYDIVAAIKATDAKRVVIDSLSGFALALAPEYNDDFRGALYRMVSVLQGMGMTVLMTSELEDRYTDLRLTPFGSASLVDAIIMQRYVEIAGDFERVLTVVKLRASAHSRTLRLYEINDDGILIRDSLPKYEGILSGHPSEGGNRAHY